MKKAKDAILSDPELKEWREACKERGERVVLTNGCFDLLHVGHLRCLEYAKALGEHLVVAVNSDVSVKELKGDQRPLVQENDRAELVAGLACVDRVVLFSEKRLTRVIENLCPDLYAKGGDYTLETMDQGERAALEACGAEICFFQLIEGQSTTGMIERLLQHGRA